MEKLEVHIQRGVVIGRVVDLKATNSNRRLPVHPNLADLLLEYNAETSPRAGNCDWLVPSPYGTGHPRWPWTIIRDPLLPAGLPPGLGSVGLHYFRHPYSTLLRYYKWTCKLNSNSRDVRTFAQR